MEQGVPVTAGPHQQEHHRHGEQVHPHHPRERSDIVHGLLIGLVLLEHDDHKHIDHQQERTREQPVSHRTTLIRNLHPCQNRQYQQRREISKRMRPFVQTRQTVGSQVDQVQHKGDEQGAYPRHVIRFATRQQMLFHGKDVCLIEIQVAKRKYQEHYRAGHVHQRPATFNHVIFQRTACLQNH